MHFIPYLLILLAASVRVIDHPANFVPVAAVALFGAVYLSRKEALLLPLAAMFISDILIGVDSLESRLTIYGCFLAISLIGLWVRNHKNFGTVLGASLLGSTLFYLITNLVVLYPAKMYAHTWAGQAASYANALPFFRNTLLGDLFYTAVLFGAYELAVVWHKRRQLAYEHSR